MKLPDRHSLALEYHENSKQPPSFKPFDHLVQYKIYCNSKRLLLGDSDFDLALQSGDSFLQTLLMRKSTRCFTSDNIGLSVLARLLQLSCGIIDKQKDVAKRTYASAGARYPIEVYVAVMRSDDMDMGIYHYNVIDNALELIKAGDYSDTLSVLYGNQTYIANYPCLIFFALVFNRTMQKYGERGYRFALIDAGHMSQNLYLVAEYLKLGIVAIGASAVSDDKLDDMLGLAHSEENTFLSFAVGIPQLDF